MVRLMSKARAKFSELLPNYFALWLVYEKKYELHHQPGLYLELFEHYVNRHSCAAACREHRNTEFPCDLRRLRGDLGRAKQLTLHSLEAELEFSVKKLRKLLDSYLFHRAANLHQRPQLDRLLQCPPIGHCVLLVDFKELLTLPIAQVEISEMFYATWRFEVCTFGGVLVEHAPTSTADAPQVETRYIPVFSSILDHTALRANQLIDVCLSLRKDHVPLRALHIVADAGPHFRSYESIHHHLVGLPQKHGVACYCHWGVEKHMKSRCDQMFGWLNKWIARAKRTTTCIKTLEELVAMVQRESAKQNSSDPASKVLVVHDESAKPPPGDRLLASGLHITRTYCLGSVPADSRIFRFKVRITNYIFSNRAAGTELTSDLYEESTEATPAWRRGFYGPGKSNWDTTVQTLGLHDETALTRRQKLQASLLPHATHLRHRAPLTQDEKEHKKQIFLQRRQKRKEANVVRDNQSSSSSSSSTDTSADEANSSGSNG